MSESQPLLVQDNESTTEENNSEGRTLRDKAIQLLESNTFHTFVIALIAIDASCVVADLIYTLLPQDCTPDQPMGDVPAWLEVLSHLSLTITTLFLLEIPLAVWAFGPRYYNPSGTVPHASLHLFDAFIILATFTLEAVLKGKERELAGLLIVFRLWRIVKLVGGIAVGAGELEEEDAKELAEVRRKLEETRSTLAIVRDENETLRRRIAAYEAGDLSV
ncbi:hypothetical protein M378DRAFT_190071 [Amanita muscaria Koide BX008]|uniref:Voltage-gated hydrogen channel 1 n=1 Tax=Amanita muscaria (strain Koide BX008) TaxID=946122 RepID=A0A0C2X5R0_AMAMK|nr:hypothetical protein M378DRAFT_190071 [Amanita muscaria Koide BX008]